MAFGFRRVPAVAAGIVLLTSIAGFAGELPQVDLSRPHTLPAYPDSAKRAGKFGTTIVAVHVNELGKPYEVETAASSGSPDLDKAAVDIVRHWKFIPAVKDNVEAAEWTAVGFTFGADGVVQVPVSPETEIARKDRERVICRNQTPVTGSHIKVEAVCKASWEWDEIARKTKDTHVQRIPNMPDTGLHGSGK